MLIDVYHGIMSVAAAVVLGYCAVGLLSLVMIPQIVKNHHEKGAPLTLAPYGLVLNVLCGVDLFLYATLNNDIPLMVAEGVFGVGATIILVQYIRNEIRARSTAIVTIV